ncbi:MAG: serine protease [Gammaproteobacteria bacterium]|nr:serine protease [Gammaproteobacteria bacterium]
MPTWGKILKEMRPAKEGQPPRLDEVRRKYLVAANQLSQRDIVLYASNFIGNNLIPPESVAISDEDITGLMEVIHGLKGPNLDLILHSPGGSVEAAEAMVIYLRSKFDHIRVIVPQLAMSAATMIACAADVIVLGKHSFLGPTDPQIILNTSLGVRSVPAQAILEQFDKAVKDAEDPARYSVWLPMLAQYGPDILTQCEDACRMSEELVADWLETYMFKDDDDKNAKACEIAEWLSNHTEFKTHARHIPRGEVEENGLVVQHLEKNQQEQDVFLSIFHAVTHTFNKTPAVKIMENHLGASFIKQMTALPLPSKKG